MSTLEMFRAKQVRALPIKGLGRVRAHPKERLANFKFGDFRLCRTQKTRRASHCA